MAYIETEQRWITVWKLTTGENCFYIQEKDNDTEYTVETVAIFLDA